jgi:hypothetical protein
MDLLTAGGFFQIGKRNLLRRTGSNRTFATTKLIDALSGPTQSEAVRLANMEQEL